MKSINPEQISEPLKENSKIQILLESIGVLGAALQTASYQQLKRSLGTNNDIIETEFEGVEGKSFDNHDYYHGLANDLIQEIAIRRPELMEILNPYSFTLNNLAQFNLQGERGAANLQNIIPYVNLVDHENKQWLKVDKDVFSPNPEDTREVYGISQEIIDTFRYGKNKESAQDNTEMAKIFVESKRLKQISVDNQIRFLDEIIEILNVISQNDEDSMFRAKAQILRRKPFKTKQEYDDYIESNSELFEGFSSLEQFVDYILEKYIDNISDNQIEELTKRVNYHEKFLTSDCDMPYKLGYDIQQMVLNGNITKPFEIVTSRFEELYGITGVDFVKSMSKLYKLFTSYYMSEYTADEILDQGNYLLLPLKPTLTRLENDFRIRSTIKKLNSRSDIEKIDDLMVLTSDTEQGKETYTILNCYKALLIEQARLKEIFSHLLDEQTSDSISQQMRDIMNQIREYRFSEPMVKASQFLIDYYGFNSIDKKS